MITNVTIATTGLTTRENEIYISSLIISFYTSRNINAQLLLKHLLRRSSARPPDSGSQHCVAHLTLLRSKASPSWPPPQNGESARWGTCALTLPRRTICNVFVSNHNTICLKLTQYLCKSYLNKARGKKAHLLEHS